MIFGVLGDVHGDFATLNAIMAEHADVAFWLSVGDVASDDLRYPEPAAPFYWIQGNNEDFNAIHRGLCHQNLRFLPNGTRRVVDGVTIAALGGTFAPTWYETAAADLPYPGKVQGIRDDKRRHFVREQVEALTAGGGGVDVLLTHEAPRPFIVQAGTRRLDAGKSVINELLAALHPRLHFFGHHHRFSDAVRGGVRSIGLDLIGRSCVLADGKTFEVTKIEQ